MQLEWKQSGKTKNQKPKTSFGSVRFIHETSFCFQFKNA